MELLIFQIIVVCLSFLALIILSGTLFFLLKTYGCTKSVGPRAIVLTIFLMPNLVNVIEFGYQDDWILTFLGGCCALLSFFSGGYIFKRLPVYATVRNRTRAFFMLEPRRPPRGLCREEGKHTALWPEKSISNLLTARQKEKLEEMLNTPDIFCHKKFTAKEFAKQAGTNVSYLNRYLKQRTGMTCSEYIISRRLDKAEKMLAETDISILDVCDSIGFKSPTSLFALFKKRRGMSPLQWRNRNRIDVS